MTMDEEAQRTLYCGNLDGRVTEEILYELFLQAGPLEKVKLPDGKNFGFITFKHPVSVEYTIGLMNGIRLFNKSLRLQPRTGGGGGTPSRQNSAGGNMNMMQNGGGMNPAVAGLMGQSPFHRSYSAPQFHSTPNPNQRFQDDSGGRGRNESPDHRDRSNDRQRERDRGNRDHSNNSRDNSRHSDKDHSFDRDQGRDYGHGRDHGKGRGGRDYGKDRSRDRDREWDSPRDRSRDRSGGPHGNFSRGDTFPQAQRYQQQQGLLMRQSGFDQDNMAANIDNELRRQRVLQQQELQMNFRQQMQEAMQNNFGRPQQNQGYGGQGRYGRRY